MRGLWNTWAQRTWDDHQIGEWGISSGQKQLRGYLWCWTLGVQRLGQESVERIEEMVCAFSCSGFRGFLPWAGEGHDAGLWGFSGGDSWWGGVTVFVRAFTRSESFHSYAEGGCLVGGWEAVPPLGPKVTAWQEHPCPQEVQPLVIPTALTPQPL